MRIKSLYGQTLIGGLLLLSGCDVAQSARNDLNRLTTASHPPPTQTASRAAPAPATTSAAKASSVNAPPATTKADPKADPPGEAASQSSVNLIGKNEDELRDLLGPPTTVEERAPGKTWRYREGQCTLDVQLYPDVQTRQFGTLAYEVKSDDNTDEGNRACVAQLRSRARSHG
jgi:hypothetical protein